MSNKTEEARTKPTAKPALVPKLRFPEFTGPWEKQELGSYLKEHTERVLADTELPVYSSTRSGIKPQKDYFDGRELLNNGEYGVVPNGYFVYRHMSDDGTFKFNINNTGERIAVSKEYPIFRTMGLHPYFLLCKLNEGSDFARFALIQKKGGTRTRLYFNTLCSWKTLLPTYSEQQKIADCLSSIDELITLETQKIDMLKAHKKGLMQQLFPAEGETLPRLRFPEFRDAGEWEIGNLESMCDSISSGKDKSDSDGKFILYGSTGVIGKTSSDTYNGEFLLAARVGANAGLLKKVKGRFGVTDNTLVIRVNKKASIDFVFYSLINFCLSKLVFGSGQPLITGAQLKSLSFKIPHYQEQQKIADCLFSVDELIALENQKLDALKAHKKGLMQQLFPVSGEVRK